MRPKLLLPSTSRTDIEMSKWPFELNQPLALAVAMPKKSREAVNETIQ